MECFYVSYPSVKCCSCNGRFIIRTVRSSRTIRFFTLASEKVGELVAEDFRRAHVFSQFGIDFCCGGGKSLAVACERANVDPAKVVAALNAATLTGCKEDQLNQLPLDQLIEYIESTHHQYVREKAPLLIEYSEKMVRAHGEHYAEIIPFAGWFVP